MSSQLKFPPFFAPDFFKSESKTSKCDAGKKLGQCQSAKQQIALEAEGHEVKDD